MTVFARPFRVSNLTGFLADTVVHGVQFPDGRCVIAQPWGGLLAATGFEHLDLPPDAVVEWADGGQP